MKMRKVISIITVAWISAFCLVSCQKDSSGEQKQDKISISKEKLFFNWGEGQTESVSVECKGDWHIENFTEGMKVWINPDALQGSGNGIINFRTFEFNPYDEKRMAVLKFVSGKASCTLVITQLPDPDRSISLSDDELDFGGALETKTLEIFTAKSWVVDIEATPVPSWLKLSEKSGYSGKSIEVSTIEVNEEIEPRSCQLDFRIDRVHSASLTVTQAPGIELKIDKNELNFTAEGGEQQTLNVSCNSPTKQWTVEGYNTEVQQWLGLDITKGIGDKTLSFTTLGKNNDLTKTAYLTIRLDSKRYLDFTVTQASGLEISVSPEKLDFGGNEADSKSVVVTTNTDKYAWEVEGYTEDVQKWLKLDVVSAASLSKQITVSTLGANTTGSDLNAELKFKLTDGVEATLNVCQEKKQAALKIISWTGDSKEQTITAPAGKDYNYLPYTTGSDPSANPVWTDGPDGPEMCTGYFKYTRDYVFKMDKTANVGSSYTLELGASTPETKCFYGNLKVHGYSGYRTRNAYVKIPAIPGFKLTGVKVICGNAADKANSVAIATNTSISATTAPTAANVLEGKSQLTLGKPTPVNVSFTKTEANTAYYLFITQDRLITGFTLTYSEAE